MKLNIDKDLCRQALICRELKELEELLDRQMIDLLESMKIVIPPRCLCAFITIACLNDATLSKVSRANAEPHQVTKIRLDALINLGLVERVSFETDKRSKLLELTKAGEEQLALIEASLSEVGKVTDDLFKNVGFDILKKIDRFKGCVISKTLSERLEDCLKSRISSEESNK